MNENGSKHKEKTHVDVNRKMERLRQLMMTQENDLSVFRAVDYFRTHFIDDIANREFLKSTLLPVNNTRLINGIKACLAQALADVGCPRTKGAEFMNNPDMEVIVLQLPESDFIRGYLGTQGFEAVILYFAKQHTGLFTLNIHDGGTGIARFDMPDLQDLSKSRVDVKLRFTDSMFL